MPKYNGHKYTWSKPFNSEHHNWELRSQHGGVHFHASIYNGQPSCGLEFHSVRPTSDSAPDHIDCPVTGGRCWHDGTSMYATDTLWPMISSYLKTGDHEQIFRLLEVENDQYFARTIDKALP